MSDGRVVFEYIGDTSKIDGYNREAEQKVSAGADRLKNVTSKAAMAIGAAFVAAGAAAVKFGMEFETAMAGVSTLYGEVQVDTDNLNNKMLELSSKTGQSAKVLGETLYDAMSSGLPVTEDMAEAMAFLEKNTKLAKGGFTDVAQASGVTLDIMNAYKLGLEDVDRIHKILMQTQNKGKITVGQLGDYLAQVTPTAAAFGVSFEQVGAAIATMTIAGTKPAQAVTALNALLSELGKNGQVAAKNLEEAAKGTEYAGMTFAQMTAAGVPLNQILDMMSNYASRNGKSLIDMFGGIEAGSGALQLAGANSVAYTDSLEAMATQADVVGDAAAKIDATNAEKMKVVLETLKNIAIGLYVNGLQPLFGALYEIGKWVIEHKTAIESVGFVVLVITGLILSQVIAVKLLAAAQAIATAATNAWTTAQIALDAALSANPIGLTILAIAALVVGVAALVKGYQNIGKAAEEAAQKEIDANNRALESQKSRIDQLKADAVTATTVKLAELDKERSAKIKAEQDKTNAQKKESSKRQQVVSDEHNAAIQAIQDEYGVFDTKERSKTKVLQDTQSAYDASIADMLNSAKSAASDEGKAFEQSSAAILQAARDTHNAKVQMYTDEYLMSIGVINTRLSKEVKAYQDQINANNAKTKKEQDLAKKMSDAARLSDLQKAISNAETADEMARANQAYNEEVQRQGRERRQAERDEENISLNEKIKTAQEKASEEKTLLLKTLSDRITAEQKLVQDNTEYNIRKLQEERIAREKAINAKYNALKEGLENEAEYLDKHLNNVIIPAIDAEYNGPNGWITLENKRHNDRMANLDQEVINLTRANEVANVMSQINAYNAQLAPLKAKFHNSPDPVTQIQITKLNELISEQYKKINQINSAYDANYVGSALDSDERHPNGRYATGTNNFPGGPIYNEQGGETVVFPSGTQIIPHDVSIKGIESFLSSQAMLAPPPITINVQASDVVLDGDVLAHSSNNSNFTEAAVKRKL